MQQVAHLREQRQCCRSNVHLDRGYTGRAINIAVTRSFKRLVDRMHKGRNLLHTGATEGAGYNHESEESFVIERWIFGA